MTEQGGNGTIAGLVQQNRQRIRLMLSLCVRCGMCAESCFLYVHKKKDPRYMPSHKMINSLGLLYKKKDDVSPQELKEIEQIAWKRCVMCMRCYCPFGIDIPAMIGLARSMCRKKGVFYDYSRDSMAEPAKSSEQPDAPGGSAPVKPAAGGWRS